MARLRQAAQQALYAWDTTPLMQQGDGMLQERMESVRAALEQPEHARRDHLTVTDLQQALVDVDLVDPDAIDDPDGFDNGFTLRQIDALHSRLLEMPPPTTANPQPASQP